MSSTGSGSINRRAFIRLAGLAAGAAAVSACGATATPTAAPTQTPIVQKVEVTRVVQVQSTAEVKVVTATPQPTSAPQPTATPVPPTATPAPKVTIVHWDSNPDAAREASWKARFATYQATHPNFTGEYVPTAATTFLQKLSTAIGGGKAPDTCDMQGGWLAQFASMGALTDLTPYFQTWKYKDDYLPALVTMAKAYDNKMYWFPGAAFDLAIIYREDWVKAAGLTSPVQLYNDGKWTWDAFLEMCKALTKASANQYGFALRGGLGGERNLFNIIMSYTGGQWFKDDGTCLLDSAPAIEAVTFYADMFRKWKVTPASAPNDGWRETSGGFGSGVCASYMHSQDGLPVQRAAIKDGYKAVGAVPLPSGPKGSWQQLDGLGVSVLAQSKNPQTAAELLFTTAAPENFDAAVKVDTDKGLPPFSTNSIDLPFKSLFDKPAYKQDPYMWAFFKVKLEGKNVYINPLWLPEYTFIVNSIVLPSFQKVLLGKQTVEEGCAVWAGEFTKAQKNYLASHPKT